MEVFEEIKLVRAREEDAERLAEISKRAFHSDIHCGAPEEGGPPGYDSPKAQISFMKSCDYYKILYDDVIVGALMVLKKEDQHYECCGLFVDPEYHNRGIATKAFELIWAKQPNVKRWTVGTPPWNRRTTHFYKKLGFGKVGIYPDGGIMFEKNVS